MWIVFVVCAGLGALSTMKWLWDYTKDTFLGMFWHYVVAKIQEEKNDQSGKKVSVETQADWCSKALEENERELMENKIFQLDLYIEELQQELNQVREERNQYLQELRISEAHGLKLMKKTNQYRVCSSGNVIHFEPQCPFYERGRHFVYCSRCVSGAGVTGKHNT